MTQPTLTLTEKFIIARSISKMEKMNEPHVYDIPDDFSGFSRLTLLKLENQLTDIEFLLSMEEDYDLQEIISAQTKLYQAITPYLN